ncbi:N-acetylserotonin O-methyltransferase-like protein [Habropoda laboriosa]|uniref:N-acetylserotonin O-methyltransferase-like protein n=1 Tax=Habropoda laboriosa TaxID=597456 RepID=A0A0L7QW63_9HYME|nr:N-acetylserotonin O-methyltransferase-like protein [Habropoda laboriosa]
MLEQTMQTLTMSRVILASGSPRRYELIKSLGINVEVVPSTYDENLDRSKYKNIGEYVQDLAKYKVQEVYERLKDTMVALGDTMYGKPKNNSHAFEILSSLANKEHTVYTGVCLKTPEREVKFYESTIVKFGDISKEQIQAYVKSGEPLDKAGAYGIQGVGGCLVEKVYGDFYTVMGMPLYSLAKQLNKIFCNN